MKKMSHPNFNDSTMEKKRFPIWGKQVEQALIGHVLRKACFFNTLEK
jgi:hypothetical protein